MPGCQPCCWSTCLYQPSLLKFAFFNLALNKFAKTDHKMLNRFERMCVIPTVQQICFRYLFLGLRIVSSWCGHWQLVCGNIRSKPTSILEINEENTVNSHFFNFFLCLSASLYFRCLKCYSTRRELVDYWTYASNEPYYM